jgi:hypothetical protein
MGKDRLRAQIGPFGIVPLWVIQRCPDARAIHLYAVLSAKYANRQRRAWPRTEQLAQVMGSSLRNVERAIRALRDAGALRTGRRRRRDGAVVGLDFELIQIEPTAQTATGGGKSDDAAAGDAQPAAGGGKSRRRQSATGGGKVAAPQPATDGGLFDGHPATGGGPIPPPVAESSKEEPDPLNQIQELSLSADADTDTAPHAGDEPPTDSRARSLLEAYRAGFAARFPGRRPQVHEGRDGKLLHDLAAAHGDAWVRDVLDWFFRTEDPFICASGYDVRLFHAAFNRLQATCRPRGEQTHVDAYDTLMRALRERGEARRARLTAAAETQIRALAPAAVQTLRAAVEADPGEAIATYRPRMAPDAFERAMAMAIRRAVVQAAQRLSPPVEDETAAIAQALEELLAAPARRTA